MALKSNTTEGFMPVRGLVFQPNKLHAYYRTFTQCGFQQCEIF
jgi:hypothetical protein